VKKLVFVGICLMIFSSVPQAQTLMYVGEVKLTLRTGPGNDRKIIATMTAGQRVELLEQGSEWSKVRLPDGKDGWMLTRYLTSGQPDKYAAETLKKEHEMLSAQVTSLLEENKNLKKENERGGSGSGSDKDSFETLSKSYNTLKSECADFLKLKSDYLKISSQVSEQKKENAAMKEELDKIRSDQRHIWVLIGGGILLSGVLIGFALRRPAKRSSFM